MERALFWILIVAAVAGFAIRELRDHLYRQRRETASVELIIPQNKPSTLLVLPALPQPGAPPPNSSCVASQLRLGWPLRGKPERDWVIANYFYDEPAVGRIRDYTGATGTDAVTYDGHTGIDIEVPSFREVDNGTPILAAADGTVEEVYDQSYDRNQLCSSDKWNYVRLRHANGYSTVYGHMKKNSLAVRVGDHVSRGSQLGQVGSSGCSSYPHVHFETLDCQGRAFDVMKTDMFTDPPRYSRSAPAAVMETSLFQPTIDGIDRIQDPGPSDLDRVSVGSAFSFAATVSHLHTGDTVRIDFLTPDGRPSEFFFEGHADKELIRSHWWGDFTLDTPGSWTARVKINGRIVQERAVPAV